VLPPAPPGSADGGAGQFGFEVPRGDPGAIDAAARGVRDLSGLFADHARSVGSGARVAVGGGGWRGAASGAFTDASGNLLGVLHGNAGACDTAAGVLGSLSRALEHAQSVTRQALADCQTAQQELTTQQQNAETAGRDAQTANQNAASAVHPAEADVYRQQAISATQAQGIAQGLARNAQGDLDSAMRRGQQAYETYMTEASALGVRLGSASAEIRNAISVPGGSGTGFPLGGAGGVPLMIPPLQTSPGFTDPSGEPVPNIFGDPTEPQGPTILADPIPEQGPTILADPIPEAGPTILADPIPEAGPTILADPIPEAGPTILADPIPEAGPTILADPIPEQLPGNGIVTSSGKIDLTGATTVSGKFPPNAQPGEVLVRRDPVTGDPTNYQVYGPDGLPTKRVDLTGSAHGGIPTPHVHEYGRNTNPATGETFVNTGPVRPANPSEVP
jgi:hypothetical protein